MRGPYHPHNPSTPIHGMGQPELPQLGFADQILREMLSASPLGIYVTWAEQVSDVSWVERPNIEWSFTCVPITDAALQQVKAASYGHEVGWVAILFDQPATINAIERALSGTPYAYDSSLAVYDPNYQGTVPKIRFLVWARLRDSIPGGTSGGGSKSMDLAASSLSGRLVYVVQGIAPSTTRRPNMPFQQALDAQLGVTPPPAVGPAPVAPAPTPTPAAPSPAPVAPTPLSPAPAPAAPASPQSSTLAWILGGGALAALALWWYSKRKAQRVPASRQLPARGETGTY